LVRVVGVPVERCPDGVTVRADGGAVSWAVDVSLARGRRGDGVA
jgi:hypothetical protein